MKNNYRMHPCDGLLTIRIVDWKELYTALCTYDFQRLKYKRAMTHEYVFIIFHIARICVRGARSVKNCITNLQTTPRGLSRFNNNSVENISYAAHIRALIFFSPPFVLI